VSCSNARWPALEPEGTRRVRGGVQRTQGLQVLGGVYHRLHQQRSEVSEEKVQERLQVRGLRQLVHVLAGEDRPHPALPQVGHHQGCD